MVRIDPNTVRIGIDAPRHLNIVRSELVVEVDDDTRLDDVANSIEIAHLQNESESP